MAWQLRTLVPLLVGSTDVKLAIFSHAADGNRRNTANYVKWETISNMVYADAAKLFKANYFQKEA